jgi:DNA-binding MarR family transcriptional regulator
MPEISVQDEARHVLHRSLGYQLRAVHHAFRQDMETRLARHGIPFGMGFYLRALWEEDGLTQKELSERAGTTEPTTVEMVRKMVERGIVERRRSPIDRRKIHVRLTRKGRRLEAKALPYMIDIQDVALEGVSEAEQRIFRSVLARMQANLVAARLGAEDRDASAA